MTQAGLDGVFIVVVIVGPFFLCCVMAVQDLDESFGMGEWDSFHLCWVAFLGLHLEWGRLLCGRRRGCVIFTFV